MRGKYIPIAVVLVVILALAGCGNGGDGGGKDARKVYDDPDETIEVAVGEEFTIVLDSNATTGYAWRLAEELDEDIVTLVGSEYIPEPGAEDRVGAGGVEEWTFEAAGAGRTIIELEYVPSWEQEVETEQVAVFEVQVK